MSKQKSSRSLFPNVGQRFAKMLEKRASIEDPSRVIITASVAGIGIGSLGKNGKAYSVLKCYVFVHELGG